MVSQTVYIIRGIAETILKKNISGSAGLVKAKVHSDRNLHGIYTDQRDLTHIRDVEGKGW